MIRFAGWLLVAATGAGMALAREASSGTGKENNKVPAAVERFRFQTKRFEIVADAPIDRETLHRFARVVDAVPAALARVPLPLLAPPDGPPPTIEVLGDAGYRAAGGAEGTSGFYDAHPPGRLLVRRSMLLAPPARQSTRLAPKPDQSLLVHELTHLCTHRYLGRTPQWFAEGVCEYLACLHRSGGRFDFDDIHGSIRDFLRRRGNSGDAVVHLAPVASLAGISGKEWLELVADLPPEQRKRPYGTALLLFHYHLHGGAGRRKALRDRLKRALTDPKPDIHWLKPGEIPVIETAIIRYWEPRGLKIRFGDR